MFALNVTRGVVSTFVDNELSRIQDTAVRALRDWLNGPEDAKTGLLRRTGNLFVAARQHFVTRTGEPDWLGRSHAYRAWVRETTSLAGIPADQTTGLLTSIRYHAGNALRARLDEATLADLGLLKAAPKERQQERNADLSRTLSVLDGGRVTDGPTMVETLHTALRLLRRLDLGAVPGLPEEDRAGVKHFADQIAGYAAGIAGAATGREQALSHDAVRDPAAAVSAVVRGDLGAFAAQLASEASLEMLQALAASQLADEPEAVARARRVFLKELTKHDLDASAYTGVLAPRAKQPSE